MVYSSVMECDDRGILSQESPAESPRARLAPAAIHSPEQDLTRFMRGELARAEMAGVVRHLLTGCPRCVEVTRQHWLGDPLRALVILREEMSVQEFDGAGRRPGDPRASLY